MATLIVDGHAAAVPILKASLRAFREEAVLPAKKSRWLSFACRAAADLWDEESWRMLATRELQRARDAGALTVMPTGGERPAGETLAALCLLPDARLTTRAVTEM
jgi:hypothetical protein